MKHVLTHLAALIIIASLCASVCSHEIASQQSFKLRVAVTSFAPAGNAERALTEALSQSERVAMLDRSMTYAALAIYKASTNMSRTEARRMGAAMGCDFFITGKAEAITRQGAEPFGEAIIGVMIVDGRSGHLAQFDFIAERATTEEAAMSSAIKTITARAAGYIERMIEFRSEREKIPSPSGERVEDLPEENSPRAAGFKPPEFLNRVKPVYTEEAERADISATVEASVVFRADGEVEQVEIMRWAGYGLDESATRAIRQLKFKPATRDGRAVSVRAVVKYNFRRVSETETKRPQSKPD
ncbi:MAG: energy transducer TonB [Acidobacteriota bacterium]